MSSERPPRRPFWSDLPGAPPPASATREAIERVDRERLRASMARVYQLFKEIATVADDVMTQRCPYKDRHDRCTAEFVCRNQRRPSDDGPLECGGDDRLDYRSAWQSGAPLPRAD